MQFSDYKEDVERAVSSFWETKAKQGTASEDKSGHGDVAGGKQMDGFIDLLKKVAVDTLKIDAFDDSCIITKNNYIPGYFRSSKNWDFLVVTPSRKLVAAIELKSQGGSYGNNFNNRAEEAIGSALDLKTAYEKKLFPNQQFFPWLGYLMIVGIDGSAKTVKNKKCLYPVLPEFKDTTYIDRYKILCNKLQSEKLYTKTALLKTSSREDYADVDDKISLESFLKSFADYLKASRNEFE